jgi:SAM-dependent methyltransferase
VSATYDGLAAHYHLVYDDWNGSVRRQGDALHALIEAELGPGRRSVLDVACGIGTQALGLAAHGHAVTASDVSSAAVQRLRDECAGRGLDIDASVADMREADRHHGRRFDVVLCADNSLPHLLSDHDIAQALRALHACTKPDGLCIVSLRDYAAEPRGGTHFKAYGVRTDASGRHVVFQVWEWRGEHYDFALYMVHDDGRSCSTDVHRGTYYAVSIDRVTTLMREAGFTSVRRLDDAFFQPVVIGRRQGDGR